MLADEICTYVCSLKVPQGPMAGQSFTLLPWQEQFIHGAFGSKSESMLSVGRGAGKTTLAAAILRSALPPGPLASTRSESLIVAGSLMQATVAFRHVLAFLGNDRPLFQVLDTNSRAQITCKRSGATVAALGCNPQTIHGRAPSMVLLDEYAQLPRTKSEAVVAALRTGLGKQEQSRILYVGTRHAHPSHWSRVWESDKNLYRQIHCATPSAGSKRPGSRATWERANPSLPHMPHLLDRYKAEWNQAKRDRSGAAMASFKALRLNMGVPDSDTGRFLVDPESWARNEVDPSVWEPGHGPPIWGVDLGGPSAMSAVASLWRCGAADCIAAFPSKPGIDVRAKRDHVGSVYQHMLNEGSLFLLGDRTVPVAHLLEKALARFGHPAAIVCDRFREAELRDGVDRLAIRAPIVTRGMGWRDGSQDVRALRRAVLGEQPLRVKRSVLLRSAVAEARTIVDVAGNEKLAKHGQAAQTGRRAQARDDAICALMLACGERERSPQIASVFRMAAL